MRSIRPLALTTFVGAYAKRWLSLGVGCIVLLCTNGCARHDVTVSSSAMKPTIQSGDKVSVTWSTWFSRRPKRWDIVVFHPPIAAHKSELWVMRVVGLPGERVSFSPDGNVLIDGKPLASLRGAPNLRYAAPDANNSTSTPPQINYPYQIPKNEYYVLGDSFRIARDSRYWGAVPTTCILGRVYLPGT
jgi:signal peptidase I